MAQALGQLDFDMVALEVPQCFHSFGVSTLPLGFWRWAFGVVFLAFGVGLLALGFSRWPLALGFWRLGFGVGLLALDLSRWDFRVWVFGVGFLAVVLLRWVGFFGFGLFAPGCSLGLFVLGFWRALGFWLWALGVWADRHKVFRVGFWRKLLASGFWRSFGVWG